MNFLTNSFLKSFLYQQFKDLDSLERWYKRGRISALFIGLFTVLLFVMLVLMKLGGVELPQLSSLHGFAVFVLLALCYGFWKRSRVASVGFVVLFVVEKSLLMYFGILIPILALPILIVLLFFLSGGVIANFLYHRKQTESEGKLEIPTRSKRPLKPYISSFFLLFLLCFTSVIARNLGIWMELLTENSILGFASSWFFMLVGITALFRKIKREFGRLPMAVVNLLVLALVTSLTTVIPQHGTVPFQPLIYYSTAYGTILSEVLFFFEMHTIFHSWWFNTLVGALVFGILKVSFHRRFTLRNFPFHLTHFSIVWIIAFAWYNYFFSFSGIIPLKEGQLSHRVQLFQNSAKKLKRDFIELPFSVLLKQFQTREWDASYKVFVQKFPKKLPPRISEEFYKNLKSSLPLNFQASVEETYVPVTKLSTNPLLSIFSAVGLNYLASYEEAGQEYLFNPNAQRQNTVMTSKIFKVMGYKAKDLHSFPIQVGKTHRIWTSDISFRFVHYYKNHQQAYIPIPNELSPENLQKEILPRIANQQDRQFVKDSYETHASFQDELPVVLSNKAETPPQEVQLKKVRLKRVRLKRDSNRSRLATIFSRMDRDTNIQAFLKSQIPLSNPALGMQIVRQGNILAEDWLNLVEKNPRNSLVFLEQGVKIHFLKDSDSPDALKQVNTILKIHQNYVPHRLNLLKDDTIVQSIALEPDAIYPLKDSPYSLRFEEYYHDFAFQSNTDQLKDPSSKYFNASKQLKNPAARFVLIQNPSQHAKNEKNDSTKNENENEKSEKNQTQNEPHEFILFSLYKKLKTQAIHNAETKTQYRFEYHYEPNLKTFVVSANPRRVFFLSSNGLVTEPLLLGKPYVLNPLTALYFTEFFSDWSQFQPIWVEAVNLPMKIPLEDFETKLIPKLSKEEKGFLKAHYQIGPHAYHLRPQFRFDSERKQEIQQFLNRVSYSYPEENPLLELEVSRDNGFKKTLLLSAKGAFMRRFPISDSRYALSFESRANQQTQYWKSHLQLLDLDNRPIPNANKVIQVNDYFYYGGYRLYQTDAKKEDPSYSGIGVTREPGLMFIYAGFVGLALGVFMMFYLPKPKTRRKTIKKEQN